MSRINSPVGLLAAQLKDFCTIEEHTLNVIINECLLFEQEAMGYIFDEGESAGYYKYKKEKLAMRKAAAIKSITNKP